MSRSKQYQQVKESAPIDAVDLETAVNWLKEHARAKFDETIELHIHLGIDANKSEQMVRGSVVLPHGSPKKKRIVVFTDDASEQRSAKEAGASVAGGEELLTEIEASGSLDADVTVAAPNMMPRMARVAKILGPKGLMPNPKTGTVTPDVVKAVEELSAGKVAFKMDSLGNIHEAVAKASWEVEKIVENIQALLDATRAVRPAAHKGTFLHSVTLSSTMGPGIKISF